PIGHRSRRTPDLPQSNHESEESRRQGGGRTPHVAHASGGGPGPEGSPSVASSPAGHLRASDPAPPQRSLPRAGRGPSTGAPGDVRPLARWGPAAAAEIGPGARAEGLDLLAEPPMSYVVLARKWR